MNTKGQCFIATAAYGSEFAEEVIFLKKFRDTKLIKSSIGRGLVNTYYLLSPPIARFIENRSILKFFVRFVLKSLISLIDRGK